MSAGILPDMYRHTARKSTVSRNTKPSNTSLRNKSTTHYSPYHKDDHNSKQPKLFNKTEYYIKVESDILQQQERFTILFDNETEQMITVENNEQSNKEIILDIIEEIKKQIIQSPSILTSDIKSSLSSNNQDVRNVIDSIMTHLDNDEYISSRAIDNKTEDNVNRNLNEVTPMENDQSTSIVSQSQIDDDIVEIEETSSNGNSQTCTCQCHKSNLVLNNDYHQFEQALKQTRLEQQQERLLDSNRLIQTLKRQHEELLNIYQQNKSLKSINRTKIDQEQQTTKLHQYDSEIQTDLITYNNSKISLKQQQSIVAPTINSQSTNNNTPLTTTRNRNTYFNTTQLSSSSTSPLQQTISRSSANAITNSTATNKTSTIITKSTIASNSQTKASLPPPPLSTSTSHDIVDLTGEDEDDNTNRPPTQQTSSTIRQSMSSIHLPTSSSTITPTPIATATTIRNQTTNRTIYPNNAVSNGQTFPWRPLPEHNPCDHTIARPQLSITQENATVRLTWNLQSTTMESIQNYEIYAYKQNAALTGSDWKKIGTVKSMRLPMAVTLKEFQSNSHYAFAVRAVSINNSIGPFCEPKTIFTGNNPIQPLHTSQVLNLST